MRIATLCSTVPIIALLLGNGPLARAQPSGEDTPKSLYEKATGAYALGNYQKAAELYMRAFEMKPDPALLYNGAQAHRLAGNKERAAELYRSYLRAYPTAPARTEAAKHADNLEREIAAARAAKAEPGPPAPPTPTITAAPAVPAAASPPLPASAVVDVQASPAAPATDASERSLLSRPVFWVVAGAVVIAAVVGVAIAASGEKAPEPTLGRIGSQSLGLR